MGACKYDKSAKQAEWKNVNMTDVDSVKGILKYRQKFDIFSNIHRHINIDSSDIEILNEEIFAIYADLDSIIKKCNFNDKQTKVLNLYMDGYTEEDIAEEIKDTQQNICGTINSMCKKIKKENDDLWYLDNILWNYKVEKNGYKICSKCGESFPKSSRFFGKDSRILDGFKSYCKKCDANSKKI